jgi:hypothetical protein
MNTGEAYQSLPPNARASRGTQRIRLAWKAMSQRSALLEPSSLEPEQRKFEVFRVSYVTA